MSGRRAVFLLLGLVIAWSYLNPAAQVQTDPGVQWFSWGASEKTLTSLVSSTGTLPGRRRFARLLTAS
jgi:hypothetical protein